MQIQIRGVTKAYRSRGGQSHLALQDVNLMVGEKEFFVILGPSGCGKSTLLNIMGGLIPLDSGEIAYLPGPDDSGQFGAPATSGCQPVTSVVFQEFALFPWRTVLQNVEFPLELRGVPRETRRKRALGLIKLVGLEGAESKYPRELSGGMKQRVGIARALICDSPVLLMDEPLSALDAQTRAIMQLELLKIWESTRRTVVYVTHNIQEAALLGDRIAILSRRPGSVREVAAVPFGRPRDEGLLSDPEFVAFTQKLWNMLKDEARAAIEDLGGDQDLPEEAGLT